MSLSKTKRDRMMIDLAPEVQMAIKIRAAKSNMTTGAVVTEAIEKVFGRYIEEAKAAIAEHDGKKKGGRRSTQ